MKKVCFAAIAILISLCTYSHALFAPSSGKNVTTTAGNFKQVNSTIKVLAVLPLDNDTGKEEAGGWLRDALIEGFESYSFYLVLNQETIDSKLKEANIDDIYSCSPQKLGEILGAEGLVYGRMTLFKEDVNIVSASVKSGARIQVVHAPTGRVIYDSQQFDNTKSLTPGGIIFASIEAIRNLRNNLLKKYPLKKKVETYKRVR
ncbi:MAG: hypothetical protein JW728_01590 [Candidatus Aureabacteria bacterium]|nr:hypothetical protein [Candidatus Auribacterota bacterium]